MLILFSTAISTSSLCNPPQGGGFLVGPPAIFSGGYDNSSPFSAEPNNEPVLAPKLQKQLESGVKELKAGKYQDAKARFEELYTISPGNPRINFWLGLSCLALNQLDDASNYLNRSDSLGPHHAQTLAVLGLVEINRANYQGAIAKLQPLIKQYPKQYLPHLLISQAFLYVHQFQDSLHEAQQAIRWSKGAAKAAEFIAGFALAKMGDTEAALKELRQFVKDVPNSPVTSDANKVIALLEKPSGR